MPIRGLVPLSALTTLQLGGPADTLLELERTSEWGAVLDLAARAGTRPLILGGGSNILAADAGCRVPVVRMATRGLRWHRDPGGSVRIEAQAGHLFTDLVEQTVEAGLTGMETLVGIPGTVGATPIQNVGAYGLEIADTLESVTAWDWENGAMVTLAGAACAFGQRTSIFKRSTRFTILSVVFRLRECELSVPLDYQQVCEQLGVERGTRVPLGEASKAVLAVRRGKGMVLDPADPDNRSVGTIFVSPVSIPLSVASDLRRSLGASVHRYPDGTTRVSTSWLMRQAGFALGQRLAPGVRMSRKHYTLVADHGATAAAFAEAARIVATDVLRATGVRLTPEPDLFGDEPVYRELVDNALAVALD